MEAVLEAVMKAGMRLIQTHKLCSFYDDKQKAKRSEGDYTHTEEKKADFKVTCQRKISNGHSRN